MWVLQMCPAGDPVAVARSCKDSSGVDLTALTTPSGSPAVSTATCLLTVATKAAVRPRDITWMAAAWVCGGAGAADVVDSVVRHDNGDAVAVLVLPGLGSKLAQVLPEGEGQLCEVGGCYLLD